MNRYLIGAVAILTIVLYIFISKWKDAVSDANRWENNSKQIESYYKGELSQIKLEKDEFKSTMADSTKKLLDSLKIKPKKVIEYTTIHHYHTDTVWVEVPTVQLNDSTYLFSDIKGCFKTSGFITTIDPMHRLTITKREYNNTDQYFLFKNKDKFNILGIQIKKFWKKPYNDLKIVSDCGKSQIRRIEVSKK